MYQILLCDDETTELDKTENMLRAYQKKNPGYGFMTERFLSPKEMIEEIREKNYDPDLLFLDIYMPGMQGVAVAKELRKMGNKSKIIFLTTSVEHALEAFRVDAAQYLVKPVSKKDMFSVLDKVFTDIEEERKRYLLLRIDGRICRVAVDDIVCCEAQGKCQQLYLADGTQSLLRMTMAEIYGMLCGYQEFAKVGASYIVNLEHVDSLNSRELCLDNGKSIYLPRGTYQPLKEHYFQYYCGGVENDAEYGAYF